SSYKLTVSSSRLLTLPHSHRPHHPSPTRRSSDLANDETHQLVVKAPRLVAQAIGAHARALDERAALPPGAVLMEFSVVEQEADEIGRATSELQSRGHLVCRLLLEEKKFDDCAHYF